MKRLVAALFFLVISSNIHSIDVDQSIDLRTGADINTSLGSRFVGEARYELVLNHHWQISPGMLIAPGWSLLSAYNIEVGYHQLFIEPLSFHVRFLNRAYHSVDISENSIIPYTSFRSRNFEADFGIQTRFTNFNADYINLIFYYPAGLVQPFFVYRVAAYLAWENPDIRLGIEIKNMDWNYAESSLDLSLNIDGVIRFGKSWAIKANLGVIPSGISGTSLDFNRFQFLLGAAYKI